MASNDLTLELVYNYLIENGGKVKNRDAVRYFKCHLTDPVLKDDNRNKFKSFVNTIAHTRTENNEKILILKSRYLDTLNPPPSPSPSLNISPTHDPRNSIGIPVSPAYSVGDFSPSIPATSPPRQPPPYRHPPPVNSSSSSLDISGVGSETPQAPPRRRERSTSSNRDMTPTTPKNEDLSKTPRLEENGEEDKLSVSVKERTQKFNRLASIEDELSPARQMKSAEKTKSRTNLGVDEEDGASIVPLEPKKCMEWYVTASKGDIQELVRLANAEPRLVKRKDPFTAYNVLHWGAKYGNAEIIKIFAGKYKVDVNGKTNGGYTPLHISAQFGHEHIFKLLIKVYKADTNIRDYSGKTAEFYFRSKEQKESGGITLRKIKGRKKQSDRDLGFLRIGSLNVRVKKTTEAFSNYFLGGSQSINPAESLDRVHKGWGSADNVNKDNLTSSKVCSSKKKSKRMQESEDVSVPSTPKSSRSQNGNESDSDSAAGFDSNWKN